MNRHLLLLPLLALLCGCSASDDGTTAATQGDPRIGFSVEANGGTRAEATAFPTDRTFRVYAWNHTGSGSWMMDKGTGGDPNSNVVSYDNTRRSWYPNYTYYWPDDRTTVDFYAIYPADVPFSTANKEIDFSTTAVTGSDDVLYCKSSTSKLGANHYATNVYAAQIRFEHALSRITFAKKEINHVTLYVNSLTLRNIKHKGTFAFDPAQWTDDSAVSPSTTTYTVIPEEKDNLKESDNYLLLMPQTLAEGAQIVVEYKIKSEDGVWLRGDDDNWEEQIIPISGDWLIGHKHTYTLTANHDIFLSCTITDWQAGNSDNVDISQD